MTFEEQIEAAKLYVKQGDYSSARRILKRLDHPVAKTYLKQLNAKHPPGLYERYRLFLLLALATLLIWLLVLVGIPMIASLVAIGQ